jgi:tRNA-2-methylthio-N6-dimethylallyladenosine synthase
LSLIREVGFTSLFTFIFSPRKGTPAAAMPDPISAEEKSAWFTEMTALQEKLSGERLAALVDTTQKALVETDAGEYYEARLADNSVVRVQATPEDIGHHVLVHITAARSFILSGEITKRY